MSWQKIDFRSAIVDSELLHSFGRRLERRSPEQRSQQVLDLLFTLIKVVQ